MMPTLRDALGDIVTASDPPPRTDAARPEARFHRRPRDARERIVGSMPGEDDIERAAQAYRGAQRAATIEVRPSTPRPSARPPSRPITKR